MNRSQNKAFTLIELLVVIAIIAILAAILFPVFAQAREKARQIACLSNMKQIGTALMMYVQDYDELFPKRWGGTCDGTNAPAPNDCVEGPTAGTYVPRSWKDMLYPYIKNRQVFKCPSNPNAQKNNIYDTAPGKELNWPGGYAMWLPDGPWFTDRLGHGAAYPQPLAGLEYPSDALIIFETSYRWPDGGPNMSYAEPAPSNDPAILPGASSWNSGHNKKKGNFVYMDGHAKYVGLRGTFIEGAGNINQWRFNRKEQDDQGLSWIYQCYTDLQNYPGEN